ncbi:Os07g0258600 [Oryza sativa Japonica Group]|uniref:Os07g0258600 protein n=1 Tax=Oryza sativa subsp. japonica TaxID=39947 RepID=A0A0N7KN81_ORYSJ|nr:Os07g0258600 [Oryza sativa Japonica Group]
MGQEDNNGGSGLAFGEAEPRLGASNSFPASRPPGEASARACCRHREGGASSLACILPRARRHHREGGPPRHRDPELLGDGDLVWVGDVAGAAMSW